MQWEQQPGESARAFAAFCIYRDLGAKRSLNAAYQEQSGSTSTAPGTWTAWSREHAWVERAEAYDQHLEQVRLAARDQRYRELESRRVDFEFENQDRLERRVRNIEKILDKADAHPITDVTQEKETEHLGTAKVERSKTKVKGINFSGYARLSETASKLAREAIIGVRPEDAGAKAKGGAADTERKPNEPGILKGEFAWIKAEPSGEQ